MDVNWHLHDQTTKVSGGLLHIGGWVAIKTDRECLTVFSEDLPALAATFAEASRVLINLDRQQYNAKLVRPADLQPITAKVETMPTQPEEVGV